MKDKKIIEKQGELIQTQKDWMILRNIPFEIRDINWVRDIQNRKLEIGKLESELKTLKSLPDEPMYPEKFVEWGINHRDLLIAFGSVSKLFIFYQENLPENKQ